jgi:hypothetical protein
MRSSFLGARDVTRNGMLHGKIPDSQAGARVQHGDRTWRYCVAQSDVAQAVEGLHAAGTSLWNALESNAKMRLSLRHRLYVSFSDVAAQAKVVSYFHEETIAQYEAMMTVHKEFLPKEHFDFKPRERTFPFPDVATLLPVAFKAMWFLVRVLQDTIYVVLLETQGDKSGKTSSMKDALENPNSTVHDFLMRTAPGYLVWFRKHREQRNRLKDAVGASPSGKGNLGGIVPYVTMQRVVDEKSLIDIREELSLEDVIEAIRMSTSVLKSSRELVLQKYPTKPASPTADAEKTSQ